MKLYNIFILFFILFGVGVSTASAITTISFDPPAANIVQGSSQEVKLMVDKLPEGLAGYNLTISLSNPPIAEIDAFTFPSWATLNDNSSLPAASVWIQAVDLTDQVKADSLNTSLGAITFRGLSAGSTNVTISVTQLDADGGSPLIPILDEARIIVSGSNESVDANFSANITQGTAPLSVQFLDLSGGGPDTWAWNFGDNSTSAEQNPVHVYETPGLYNVSLTVNLTGGNETLTDSITKPGYIKVQSPGANGGIELYTGWNFISLPCALKNAGVDYLLAGIVYESVLFYNTESGLWEAASELEAMRGYWIKMNESGVIPAEKLEKLEVDPRGPGPGVKLYRGWNAIGHTDPGKNLSAEFTLKPIDDYYSLIIGSWDPETASYAYTGVNGYKGDIQGKYIGTDIFMMGSYKGYWLLVSENTTLYSLGW